MLKLMVQNLISLLLGVYGKVFCLCLNHLSLIKAFFSFFIVNLAFIFYFLILCSVTNFALLIIFPVSVVIFSYNFLVNYNKFIGVFSWIICFCIPKIFEVSAFCVISSFFTILRVFESAYFFEILRLNFLIFLFLYYMLSFFLFLSNKRVKIFFLKSLCIASVIFIYISFFVATAFAVDELPLVVKDDYSQISDKKKGRM